MKVRLLHRDLDFELPEKLPADRDVTASDVALETLLATMARGDDRLHQIARTVLLSGLGDVAAIAYRQQVLRDCLEHDEVVIELYELAVAALAAERTIFPALFRSPDSVLSRSVRVLEAFVEVLKRVCQLRDEHAASFSSEAFVSLFATLADELDDEFFREVDDHLQRLRFRGGVLLSAQLGPGNRGEDFVLRAPQDRGWRERLPFGERSSHSFQIAARDEGGARALADIRNLGVQDAAGALSQSCEHMRSFFRQVRDELGFYVGCLNLYGALGERGVATCFPRARPAGEVELSFAGLRDASLCLTTSEPVIGNDLQADGKPLVIVTGANQGGKSTFLRSVGIAQLMLQCGMFVTAESFTADLRDVVFTHFKREEDATMESGKLDEELARMSEIVDLMSPQSVLLCNESFASTNEREGSEIARQIVHALLAAGVKVFYVTHMFDLAHGFYEENGEQAVFLRAERTEDGRRTFRLVEGEPLPTSFGEDVYARIFGSVP